MIKNNKKYVPVLVVDFGSQTTQLILRRIREIGIYCEVISYHQIIDKIKKHVTLKAVHGNIDNHLIRKEYPEYIFFKCEEIKVLIIHIGGYPGKYTKKSLELINQHKPDIFICGHSHILKVIYDKKYNLIHINPGAIGKYGIHKVRTLITLEIDKSKLLNMKVVEFKR